MRTLVLLFLGSLLFTQSAFSMSYAGNLKTYYDKATKKYDRWLYGTLLNATGYLAMFAPVKEDIKRASWKDITGEYFKITGCSFVYVAEPALMLTQRHCLADPKTGEIHEWFRYARAVINDRVWKVDPLSIVLHPKDKNNRAKKDLAVFSVVKDDEKAFADAHDPIPIIPADIHIPDSQTVYFVSYGAYTEGGTEFGIAQIKEFIRSYPSPGDIQASMRRVKQEVQNNPSVKKSYEDTLLYFDDEQISTYVTRDKKGEKNLGIICRRDSGGGVFALMNRFDGNHLYLIASIHGKVGRDGNRYVACEETDGYAVAINVAPEHTWLRYAKLDITLNRANNRTKEVEFANLKRPYFKGSDPYTLWENARPERLEALFEEYKGQYKVKFFEGVHRFMKEEERIQAFADVLLAKNYKEQEKTQLKMNTDLGSMPEPWPLPPGQWIALRLDLDTVGEKRVAFNLPSGSKGKWAKELRILNEGDNEVSISNVSIAGIGVAKNWPVDPSDKSQVIHLEPGDSTPMVFSEGREAIRLNGLKVTANLAAVHLKIHANLATDQEVAGFEQDEWNELKRKYIAKRNEIIEEQNDVNAAYGYIQSYRSGRRYYNRTVQDKSRHDEAGDWNWKQFNDWASKIESKVEKIAIEREKAITVHLLKFPVFATKAGRSDFLSDEIEIARKDKPPEKRQSTQSYASNNNSNRTNSSGTRYYDAHGNSISRAEYDRQKAAYDAWASGGSSSGTRYWDADGNSISRAEYNRQKATYDAWASGRSSSSSGSTTVSRERRVGTVRNGVTTWGPWTPVP